MFDPLVREGSEHDTNWKARKVLKIALHRIRLSPDLLVRDKTGDDSDNGRIGRIVGFSVASI